MNSKQLWTKRRELVNKSAEAFKAGNEAEVNRIEGELQLLDEFLDSVIAEEDELRVAGPTIVSDNKEPLGAKILGPKAQFKGIEPDFKAQITYQDYVTAVKNAVSGLDVPTTQRNDLPGVITEPTGFLSTLPKGRTDGHETFFLPPVFTNGAQKWTSGSKAESYLKWSKDTAHIQVVAHQMPIEKPVANRYTQLNNIVSSTLLTGLDLVCDQYALRANDNDGIIGITNKNGIILHTKKENKNIRDTIQTMARKARVASGHACNYVCMSPYALEELQQTKDDIGRYLFPDITTGVKLPGTGLTIVEDVNMTYGGKESILVYWSGAAQWNIADDEAVTIGLVDKQFIQNSYTLLAELTAALKVQNPFAFAYCSDIGLVAEDIDSE